MPQFLNRELFIRLKNDYPLFFIILNLPRV